MFQSPALYQPPTVIANFEKEKICHQKLKRQEENNP